MAVCVVTVTSATGLSSVEKDDGMMFQIYDQHHPLLRRNNKEGLGEITGVNILLQQHISGSLSTLSSCRFYFVSVARVYYI